MLCEQCNTREASIVIREIVNGNTTEHHLCSQCAAQSEYAPWFDGDFPFAKLLSGMLGLSSEAEKEDSDEESRITCPVCGTTYGDFVKNGRFGCAECYDTFGLLIQENIKKIQGSDAHTGKHPKFLAKPSENAETSPKEEQTREEKIKILTARQKEAVANEDYEAAARYRDQIRALKEG